MILISDSYAFIGYKPSSNNLCGRVPDFIKETHVFDVEESDRGHQWTAPAHAVATVPKFCEPYLTGVGKYNDTLQ